MLPPLGCCEQCHYERGFANISSNSCFPVFWICSRQRNCWGGDGWGVAVRLPAALVPLCSPTNSARESQLLPVLFCACHSLVFISASLRGVRRAHTAFPSLMVMWSSLACAIGHSNVLFKEVSIRVFATSQWMPFFCSGLVAGVLCPHSSPWAADKAKSKDAGGLWRSLVQACRFPSSGDNWRELWAHAPSPGVPSGSCPSNARSLAKGLLENPQPTPAAENPGACGATLTTVPFACSYPASRMGTESTRLLAEKYTKRVGAVGPSRRTSCASVLKGFS